MKLLAALSSRSRAIVCGALIVAALGTGCRTTSPLPPADLSSPGWQVNHGQAVWQPPRKRPELAGEIFVAQKANGQVFVQFTKDPFPLVTAQITGERWQIDFGAGQRSWRGRGQPPVVFLWFQLPAALDGEEAKLPWKFSRTDESWRLENPRTGEWLEGRFFK